LALIEPVLFPSESSTHRGLCVVVATGPTFDLAGVTVLQLYSSLVGHVKSLFSRGADSTSVTLPLLLIYTGIGVKIQSR
jgi:hypothetical protein